MMHQKVKNKSFSREFTHLNPTHFLKHNTRESWMPMNGSFTFLSNLYARVHVLIYYTLEQMNSKWSELWENTLFYSILSSEET